MCGSRHVSAAAHTLDHIKDLEKEEIVFLRKKMMYMESIGKLYRDKVGGLVRNRSSIAAQQAVVAFNEIDSLYERALEAWKQENDTQFREMQRMLGIIGLGNEAKPERADGNAGRQVAENRTQAQLAAYRYGHQRRNEVNDAFLQ